MEQVSKENSFGSLASNANSLVSEIEATDDCWGSTLRVVYDSNEVEDFMDLLKSRIKVYDNNIEQMCNFYYEHFIGAVNDLLCVKKDVTSLKNGVAAIDTELSDSCVGIVERCKELYSARDVLFNIDSAITVLEQCLPVLDTYMKLKKQMAEGSYTIALKTIVELESGLLSKTSMHQFSQKISEGIPQIKSHIKAVSITKLKDYLENVRQNAQSIGHAAMRFSAIRADLEPLCGYLSDCDCNVVSKEDFLNKVLSYSSVYFVETIFSKLGCKSIIQNEYRKQREQQLMLALKPGMEVNTKLKSVLNYLETVSCFFIVETHILHTTDLVDEQFVEDSWSTASSQISVVLQNYLSYCSSPGDVLAFKRIIYVFVYMLQDYDLNVFFLESLLLQTCDCYTETLLMCCLGPLRSVFEKETYLPIFAENEAECDAVLKEVTFFDPSFDSLNYPRKFPFSRMVIEIYVQIKSFIHNCYNFVKNLSMSISDKLDYVRHSTNLFLTRTLYSELLVLVRRTGLGILNLVQISVNTEYLEQAGSEIEELIDEVSGCRYNYSHALYSCAMGKGFFLEIRTACDNEIWAGVQSKVDDFLQMSSFNWMATETPTSASPHIIDLLTYLYGSIQALASLAASAAERVCDRACEYLAQRFRSNLIDPPLGSGESANPRQMTLSSLEQVYLDLIECEKFAASDLIPNMKSGKFTEYFADTHALLDLCRAWDWSTFVLEYGNKSGKYHLVSATSAESIFQRIRDVDRKTRFSMLSKSERDRRKANEQVHKQLRQLREKPEPQACQ